MTIFKNAWYRVGMRPVKTILHEDGSFGAYAMNWETGVIELNMHYMRHVVEGADNMYDISEQAFDQLVAEYRKKHGL